MRSLIEIKEGDICGRDAICI